MEIIFPHPDFIGLERDDISLCQDFSLLDFENQNFI